MKMFIKAAKVLMVNLIICSLLQNPFISEALAASPPQSGNGGFEAKDILTLANGALNLYGNYIGQKQQIMQAQISAANNQKLMAQLSPTCRKPDGTACYTTPAKFFPECTLPASMSNMPANACNNTTPDPSQISSMITYESVAQGWMNYYDQMSNEASNATYAVGLRCLEDKQKAIDSQITEMMNSLQRLQDRLNQDKQVFRDNNKKLLEDMNTANDELFGMGDVGKKNLNLKTQDFAKYFSQSCQSVIGKEALKGGTANGLNGILQGLSSTNKAASDFNLNKASIEDDVRREAQKISTSITSGGIDDWLNNSKTQSNIKSTKFPAMENVVKKQADELMTARQRINKELAKVGYTPPAMDNSFSVDMNSFIAGADDYFKKKYVNDCVTGASSGIAIPVEDILKALEQKATNSSGTARDDYRVALKRILDSDSMITDKMDQIKALESNYPGMSVTYKDATQNRVTETPYSLFMKTIDQCQQRYTQDDQFTSKGSNGVSNQQNVSRAKAALQELKNLNDSFAGKVTSSITDQIFNCNGESFKSGSDCNENTLQTTSDNFCLAHANQCANDIQGCYAEANTQIQTRKTKMQNLAKTYNANVAAMIARSNALYEQQKAAVTNITKMIQSKFPGTNFEIPKDMFVSMPEMKKDTYGVEMAGDGNIASFLEGEGSMPAKIDKLKSMFKSQRDLVAKATGDYITLQKDAMTRERGRWEALNSQCKKMVDDSSKALAQMNSEGQKKQAEEDAKVRKYCSIYSSINENPVGACGKAKDLAELSGQISNRLSGQADSVGMKYANACDSYMNQSDALSSLPSYCTDGTAKGSQVASCNKLLANAANSSDGSDSVSPKKSGKKLQLSALCGDGSVSDSDFISKVAGKLSADDKKKLDGTNDFSAAQNKADSDSDPLMDASFFDNIADITQGATGNTTCQKIVAATTPDPSYDDADTDAKIASKDTPAADLANLKKMKKDFKDKTKKANDLKKALADLADVNTPAPLSGKALLADNVSKIGQQTDGPCDMQSNATVAKGMNSPFDLPTGFDQKVLGSSK